MRATPSASGRTTSRPRSLLWMARLNMAERVTLLQLKFGRDRPDVLGFLEGTSSRSISPCSMGFGAGFPAFSMVHCACSSPLFAEGVSMRRFQMAATFGPLSARSSLYRQPYQRREVGI
jgi:hypothetical protein